MVITAVARAHGASHRAAGLPCQDCIRCKIICCTDDSKFVITAIADGHGAQAHDLSEDGARYAVDSAIVVLMEILRSGLNGDPDITVRNMVREFPEKVISAWKEAIYQDAKIRNEECNPSRYGTTLTAAIYFMNNIVIFNLGDGSVVVRSADNVEILWEDYEEHRGNFTDSMCQENAHQLFKIKTFKNLRGVFIATDGLVNGLAEHTQLINVANVYWEMLETKGGEYTAVELQKLALRVTNEGSGDDISISVLAFPETEAAQ